MKTSNSTEVSHERKGFQIPCPRLDRFSPHIYTVLNSLSEYSVAFNFRGSLFCESSKASQKIIARGASVPIVPRRALQKRADQPFKLFEAPALWGPSS
jgi:hypothetical protein